MTPVVIALCILSAKAAACGCWPVTTRVAAVAETTLTGDLVSGLDWSKWPGGEPSHEAMLWEESGYVPPGEVDRRPLFGLRDDFTRRYRDVLIARLLDPPTPEMRATMREKAIARFDWAKTAERFEQILFGEEP